MRSLKHADGLGIGPFEVSSTCKVQLPRETLGEESDIEVQIQCLLVM